MKKLGLVTILSIVANVLLSAWAIWDYQNNPFLQSYVRQAIPQSYAPLVLASGIGGGSTLGYLLLRRRQPGLSIGGRLQRAKSTKQAAPVPRSNGTSLQNRNIPLGAPPGPASKHTAYAVPPLPKPGQSVQRSSPSSSWAATPRPWSPNSSQGQRQEQPLPASKLLNQSDPQPSHSMTAGQSVEHLGTQPYSQASNREPSDQPQRISQASQALPPFLNPRQEPREPSVFPRPFGRTERNEQTSPKRPDSPNEATENDKAITPFPNAFSENPSRPSSDFSAQSPVQSMDKSSQPMPPFQSSRLQTSDPRSPPSPWANPVPRQEYSTPRKWQPPSVSPVPNPRPQAPSGSSFGPGRTPQNRAPLPGQQGPPRPLTYPGSLRPSPGSEVPGMFRPELRRPLGADIQQRPRMTVPRPASQAFSHEAEKEASLLQSEPGQTQFRPQIQRETQPSEPTSSGSGAGESSAGEMDWDTALDAILKTLRKDKVGEKP